MRIRIHTVIVGTVVALMLASCAQQPTRPTEPSSPPPASKAPPPATPSPATKPKPKPKPAAPPKSETKEPESVPTSPEGIEPSKAGYYVDTLQGRLRQLVGPDIVVARSGDHIVVDVGAPSDCAALVVIAKALLEYRMTRTVVDVPPATDDIPGRQNARSRGEFIAKCLADAGVGAKRITVADVTGPVKAAAASLRIEPIVRKP